MTVEDVATRLGVPPSEVQQRVIHLRSRPQSALPPMSNSAWLQKRLWVWVLASLIVVSISVSTFGFLNRLPLRGPRIPNLPKISIQKPNYKNTDGIYAHDKIVAGRELKLESIPGFSYELALGAVDVAVNGDSKSYVPAEDLSPESTKVVQEQMTQKILEALDKTVAAHPPEWTLGEAVAVVKPNYYPGGDPVPIDVTLRKDQFPYRPNSPAGQALHEKLLAEISRNWDDILDN